VYFSDIFAIVETEKERKIFDSMRRKKGRPPKDIRGNQIHDLIANGFVLKELAHMYDCHRDTIYSRFSSEIKKGRKTVQNTPRIR
jgi:DNA invertase Pin-like site-specific DNA recombinase